MDDDDKAAIGAFFSAFEKLDTVSLSVALRSLSTDPQSIDDATTILDFEARLKLLERMAFARSVPAELMSELEQLLLRARKLGETRAEVARTMNARTAPDPKRPSQAPGPRKSSRMQTDHLAQLVQLANSARTAARVDAYTREAIGLQEALRAISERLAVYATSSDANP